MESVKRFDLICVSMCEAMDGDWTRSADFDRVSAENLALQQRLTVQDQREDDLKELLVAIRSRYTDSVIAAWIDAALKPTAEAEPQCLLCLDKKTVPGNIPGGFVKDCPDCCGEEG